MVSQKRDKLLSDLEKLRLKGRRTLDSRTRTTNDIRIKRKLSAWLKGIEDVLLILSHLEKKDIENILDDMTVLRLAISAVEMMRIMGYRPIIGDVGHPETWQAMARRETSPDISANVPATDADIIRSSNLTMIATMLETMLESENNPVSAVIKYKVSRNNPAIVGFLKTNPIILSDYEKGLAWVAESGAAVIRAREQNKSHANERNRDAPE